VLSRDIRVIVLCDLPLDQRNAVLAFFSFDAQKVQFALEHYQWQLKDGSTIINPPLSLILFCPSDFCMAEGEVVYIFRDTQ